MFYLKHWGGALEEAVAGHQRWVEKDVVLDDVAGGECDGEADAGDGDHLHRSVDSDPQQDVVAL